MDQTVCKNSDSQCNSIQEPGTPGVIWSLFTSVPNCSTWSELLPRPGVRPCYFRYGTPALL